MYMGIPVGKSYECLGNEDTICKNIITIKGFVKKHRK